MQQGNTPPIDPIDLSALNDRLHQAATQGDIPAMSSALVCGAELESKDGEGNTALHRAATRITGRACAWLLELGADADAGDRAGNRPLHMAALLGSLPSCRPLWAHGADLDALNDAGEAPIASVADQFLPYAFLRAAGAQQGACNAWSLSRIEAAVTVGAPDLLIAAIELDPGPPS